MAVTVINAEARPRRGKGAARTARREGKVPGVIYGDRREPETIAIEYFELLKLVNKGQFLSTVFDVKVGSGQVRVIPRDVQLDPVKDQPIHVDFQRVGADGIVRVFVPVRFTNQALSPGLKRGGVLNVVRHEVEVYCPADHIPSQFEISLEGLEIGRSIHISAVSLPKDVRPTITNRDFTIATIAGASAKGDVVETTEAAPDPKAVPSAKGGDKPDAAAAAPAKPDAKAAKK